MSRFNVKPERLANELIGLNTQLVDGLHTLSQLPEVDVGQSSHHTIYREDKLQLNYYPADNDSNRANNRPLLIVYALINRPYILDLQPDRSLIRALNQRGVPVYLIDWGYPDMVDCCLDLDDYINGYIDNCVSAVCQHSGHTSIDLLGVCQGGAFSLCYSALNPERIGNLITLVTPVDFKTPDNMLSHLAQKLDLNLALEANGNIPGHMLTQTYNALMPIRLGLQKALNMPSQLATTESAMNFLRMEKWINDSPDLAGEACREFVQKFFHDNRFIEGGLEIGEQAVELKHFTGPLLNIFAARDHLVPPSASKALRAITGSLDYQELELAGGHIGVFVGRHAQQQLPDLLNDWLEAHA
ncbi:MAG: class III poly(R)-hydroxyalkanoic acid synthase subunit PhaC [Halopseudomonas sp.]